MHGLDRGFALVAVDEDGNLDFAGGDHPDVHPGRGQRGEHLGGDAGVLPHAGPHDGDLRHVRPVPDFAVADLLDGRFRRGERVGQFRLRDGEGDFGQPVAADVLHHHVDGDFAFGHAAEDAAHHAGAVRQPDETDAGFVAVERDAGDDGGVFVGRGGDERSLPVGIGRPHAQMHVILLREFDRAGMHHAGAEAGQLQHFVVGNVVDFAGVFHHARVGREDAFHVGVDFAFVGPQYGGQRRCRGVTAAAAQRGDVEIVVDSLKTAGDDDFAGVQPAAHAFGGDAADAGLGEGRIGDDADLAPVRLTAGTPNS